MRAPLQSLLCIPELSDVYDASNTTGSPLDFCRSVLEQLDLHVKVRDEDLARIPAEGPLVVVANHPFGGIEGLVLADVVGRRRADVKLLANYILACFPAMRDLCIFVDPFDTPSAKRSNIRGLRESITWLRDGHAIAVFPAGEVAHLDLHTRQVTESPWTDNVVGLIRRTGATIVPLHFAGANGAFFQLAGLIHPLLRTVLLPRQLLNKQHAVCHIQIGSPITAAELNRIEDNQEATEYVQLRTQALAGREVNLSRRARVRAIRRKHRARRRRAARPMPPVAPPVSPEHLLEDVNGLPPEARLFESADHACYLAEAEWIPNLLFELGRLRETTFRTVGEGTGQPLDLDPFDRTYLHLLLWNHRRTELVGAYRLGPTDRVSPGGAKGLYVSTCFALSKPFLERLGPSLELGRSFVRQEYQHSLAPVMLLWKGIGQFFVRNPYYRHLFGPVSISNAYRPLSRALMVAFLQQPERRSELAPMVRSRTPFDLRKAASADVLRLVRQIRNIHELNRLISDIEPDGKGVPPLLKQYVKFGARSLAFNIDPKFGYCLDCLCLFDTRLADRRTMERYLGEPEAIERFCAAHNLETPPAQSG
ncbi:MAG: lysophospholipid acyltransferase family protein [Armatimonadetes bacterium]|nr:lysophospholipid acyltransferase family protein [Armatimonadota bacterium]